MERSVASGSPVSGRDKVAAFLAAAGPQGAAGVAVSERELNGQPALVLAREGRPFAVILFAVKDGLVSGVFLQADVGRLGRVERARDSDD